MLAGINGAFNDKSLTIEARLEKLEEVLLQSDIGAATSSKIISDLRIYAREQGLEVDDIFPVLRARLIEALKPADIDSSLNSAPILSKKIPTVIFVIGANGSNRVIFQYIIQLYLSVILFNRNGKNNDNRKNCK